MYLITVNWAFPNWGGEGVRRLEIILFLFRNCLCDFFNDYNIKITFLTTAIVKISITTDRIYILSQSVCFQCGEAVFLVTASALCTDKQFTQRLIFHRWKNCPLARARSGLSAVFYIFLSGPQVYTIMSDFKGEGGI